MHKSKFLALLLAVAMVVSMVVVPVYAAEGEIGLKLIASSATVEPGGTVDVTLSLETNPGFNGLGMDLSYPEGWIVESVDKKMHGKVLESEDGDLATFNQGPLTNNPVRLVFNLGLADLFGKGEITKVTFKVPENASGKAEFSLSVDQAINVAKQNVPYSDIENITVDVSSGEEPAGSECPECGQVVTWTEVKAADWANGAALTSGHYKLVEDVAPTTTAYAAENAATAAALSVAAGEKVCIDLNSYNITAGALAAASDVSYRVFYNEGTLSIMDKTAAEDEGVYTAGIISGGAMKEQGSGDYKALGYGGNVCNMGGTFTLHSGIIADGYLTGGAHDGGDNGGNIYSDGGVLNIKGGIVRDGSSKRTSQNGTGQGGGNIYAKNTDVNITGGTISGGRLYGTYNYNNTADRRSFLRGGNLFVTGGSLEISNATISGGKIEYDLLATKVSVTMEAYGGNVYAFTADVNIRNSSITNGLAKTNATGKTKVKCESFGGNLYFIGATNTLTIDEKSTISGGQAVATGAAATDQTATVTLSPYGGNIYLKSGTMNMGGTISGGSAYNGSGIYMVDGTVTLDGTIDNCDCAYRGAGVYQNKGTLNVNGIIKNCDAADRGGAICGDSTGTTNLAGMITACTATRGSAYFTPGDATLNVYDGAYIFGNESTTKYGTILMVGTTATMNMYGGTITNSVSGDPTVYNMYSKVNVYGGVIEHTKDGTVMYDLNNKDTGAIFNVYGGIVNGTLRLKCTNSTLNMFGGYVKNITAVASAGCVATVYNGTVGANVEGVVTVPACTTAAYGKPSVFTHAVGTCAAETPCGHTFNAPDAENPATCATCNTTHTSWAGHACAHGCENPTWVAWDGTTKVAGSHYYVPGDMTMSAGYEGKGVCLDLNGYTVTAPLNTRAFRSYNGVFNIMDSSAANTGTIKGNGVIDGSDSAHRGLIYITSGTINMYGGTVTDGHCADSANEKGTYGGNFYIMNGILNMYQDATVSNGTADYRAGNIHLSTSSDNFTSVVNMYHNSKILDGRLERATGLDDSAGGANLYIPSNTFLNMYDNAMISGGEGGYEDGQIYVYDNGNDDVNAKVTVNGGSVLCEIKIAGTAEMAVKAGTLVQNPVKYLDEAVCLEDVSEGKWIVSDFTTALEASGEGDTITLGMDVKDDGDIELEAGVTLDLNGKNLETTGDASFVMIGADVKDSKGTGTLKGATVAFNGNNSMLPITLEGVTKFQPKPPVKSGFTQSEGETRKFAFYFKDKAQDTLIDDALNADGNDLDIQFVIKVNNDEEVAYTLRTDGVNGALQDYVKNFDTKALQLTIDGLQETDVVTCEVRVASNGAYVDTVTE